MKLRQAEFTATRKVGRLVECRLVWLDDTEDVAVFQRLMLEAFTSAGPHSVICADWRQALVFPPRVSDALLDLLRRGNRELSRSAVLLSASDATFGLQVERLIREAGNPNRRSFRATEPALAWLSEVLTPAERIRASAFLLETAGGLARDP
jgi:hypothetical protein